MTSESKSRRHFHLRVFTKMAPAHFAETLSHYDPVAELEKMTAFNTETRNDTKQVRCEGAPSSCRVSRLRNLHYRVASASAQSSAHPAVDVSPATNRSFWTAYTKNNSNTTLVLQLDEDSLVGFIKLANRSVSVIEVGISLTNKRKDYLVGTF